MKQNCNKNDYKHHARFEVACCFCNLNSLEMFVAFLFRTNSDSALHTSVMNPNVQDSFNCGPGLAPQNRRSGESGSPNTAERLKLRGLIWGSRENNKYLLL